jgi:hypothetical protein
MEGRKKRRMQRERERHTHTHTHTEDRNVEPTEQMAMHSERPSSN